MTEEARSASSSSTGREREHGSWRLGERARQRYPHRYREIELRPLPDDASRVLAANAAEGRAARVRSPSCSPSAPAATRSSSRRRCATCVERGACSRENGTWTLAVGAGRARRSRRSSRARSRRGSTGSTRRRAR